MQRLLSNNKIKKQNQDIKGYSSYSCGNCTNSCTSSCAQTCSIACSNHCHALASLA